MMEIYITSFITFFTVKIKNTAYYSKTFFESYDYTIKIEERRTK
jgi:hypothetical protein